MTWNLSCDRCGADYGGDIRGVARPQYPKGWELGAFLYVTSGKQTYREPSDFCPDCISKYGHEFRPPWAGDLESNLSGISEAGDGVSRIQG